jgi:hypothetical protein
MRYLRLVAHPSKTVLAPNILRLLKVFDEAWDAVKTYYGSDSASVEAGRLRLANCLLAKYRDGLTNPGMLKAAALRSMQR